MTVEEALGHSFRDRTLYETALTHPSYGKDHGTAHYQRLEFLGDSVLQLFVSRMLYDAHTEFQEGQLSFIRSRLVREETLAEIALTLGIDREMRLSNGEERSGGRHKPSILADMVESLLAAVYLDGGIEEAQRLVSRLFAPRIEDAVRDGGVDAKSRLQMATEKIRPGLRPEYAIIAQEGPSHNCVFTCAVSVDGVVRGEGRGHSKREAERNAADMVLKTMISEGSSFAAEKTGTDRI